METIENNLEKSLQLSPYETKIYLACLKMGQGSLTEIAKVSGIPRTAVYPPLQSLLKRGIFSIVLVGKRKHYRPLEPQRLRYVYEKNKILLDEAVEKLAQSITVPNTKLSVRYFPGAEGILTASQIFLDETRSNLWNIFENPAQLANLTGNTSIDKYVKQRIERNIFARDIIPANSKSEWIQEHVRHDRDEKRETIIVSPHDYPIEASVVIADDMVLMINTHGNPFTVLIKNQALATTFNSVFDMVWDRYKS